MKRTLSFVVLALVAAIMVAGCGDNASTTSNPSTNAASGSYNNADVTFAQSMVPHHRQAVEMSKMAQTHASDPEVKQFATTIEVAQGPEIDTMTGWLEKWGKKVPAGSESGMGGMDHAGGDMAGMMSDGDMKNLSATKGTMFDRMFLTMMMSHHSGAIEMAKTEQRDGKNPDAVGLAVKIEADQTAEMADMKKLLNS